MSIFNKIQSKILAADRIRSVAEEKKRSGDSIVFTNGCFDILHLGHIQYLAEAKELGDFMIIGLNSDSSIAKLKGPDRPLNGEHSRAILLASLEFVDAVVIFEEETPIDLISLIIPDVLVKGGDWKPEEVVGREKVMENGGKVVCLPYVKGYSTTGITEKIIDIYRKGKK